LLFVVDPLGGAQETKATVSVRVVSFLVMNPSCLDLFDKSNWVHLKNRTAQARQFEYSCFIPKETGGHRSCKSWS